MAVKYKGYSSCSAVALCDRHL